MFLTLVKTLVITIGATLASGQEQDCSQCGIRRPAQLGLFPVDSRALSPLPERFLRQAHKLLDHMELFGWTAKAKDGSIVNAAALRSLLKDIKVRELDAFGKPLGASRFTAFYDPSSNTIFLNSAAVAKVADPELLGGLALHELFGLAKVEDEKYQRSALLLASSRLEAGHTISDGQRLRFRSAMSHFLLLEDKGNEVLLSEQGSNKLLASGGTRVGGGGDYLGLEFKALLLEQTLRENREVAQLVRGASLEVEVSDVISQPVLQAGAEGKGVAAVILPRTADLASQVRRVLDNPRWAESAR
jgi:hypothetical protein